MTLNTAKVPSSYLMNEITLIHVSIHVHEEEETVNEKKQHMQKRCQVGNELVISFYHCMLNVM